MSMSIFDIIILAGGVYLLWAAYGMKSKHKIPGMLVSKNVDLTKAKDIPAFCEAMFLPSIITGIGAFLSGAMGVASIYVEGLMGIQLITMLLAFLLLLWYGYMTVRCQKKFLGL